MRRYLIGVAIALALAFLLALPAAADRLLVPTEAPFVLHFGAGVLLVAHILGGTVGLGSGFVAGFSRKGGRIHRAAGKVFYLSMFVTYLIGAAVAPFLSTGQRPNFVAGVLALYLLVSGVLAAKTPVLEADRKAWSGLIAAVIITGMGILFSVMGANSETGTVDGSPPQAFIVFIIGGGFALFGELNLLFRRQLIGTARVSRHLWRMCMSFFFASGSLFMGQAQIFPDWFNGSALPFLFSFLPIFILIYWQVRIRWKGV